MLRIARQLFTAAIVTSLFRLYPRVGRQIIATLALKKRSLATLENATDETSNLVILQTSARIRNDRKARRSGSFCGGNYYLIGIGINHQVWVVRDEDDLPPLPGGAKILD